MLSQAPNLQLKELHATLKNPEVQLTEKISSLQKVSNELDRLFSDQLINEILEADILDDIIKLCHASIESENARRGILHFFATLSMAGPSKTKLLLDLGVLSATLAALAPPISPESAKQVQLSLSPFFLIQIARASECSLTSYQRMKKPVNLLSRKTY